MASKYVYTDEMVEQMHEVCKAGVTNDIVETLVKDFEFPRRSVTAKLRKLGYDVPHKPGDAPTFSPEQTEDLKAFLEENEGKYTAEQIATEFFPDFSAKQITGKALSLEMTGCIKPAEKKETPKAYTDEEEAIVRQMAEDGSYLEEIADKVGKTVQSVRGKLLSMKLTAPQRDKKAPAKGAYDGIGGMLDKTVEELAEHFNKTVRGVKTVLARNKLACANYKPKTIEDE